jgi:protein-S-isoprenylcysteine O-methyltransferase Ste14
MNTNTSVEQTKDSSNAPGRIGKRAVLRFVIFLFLLPAVLFISAGRLDWWMAWALVGLLVLSTAVSRIVVMYQHPELLAERARSLDADNAKEWDKPIVAVIGLFGPLVTWIVAGLDVRFGWSPQISLIFQLVALVIVVGGYFLGVWAMLANKFFSAVVRIQEERGHTVVTDGPYRWVRHPAYTGGVLAYLATPIMLGSLWALIPAGLTVVVLIIRTALEDKTLREELPGYDEYAQQTRHRLVPGIW